MEGYSRGPGKMTKFMVMGPRKVPFFTKESGEKGSNMAKDT